MDTKISCLTEKLLHYNGLFLENYRSARESGKKQDFHQIIKPFVDHVEELNDEWKSLMKKWLAENTAKHIHLKQVETTADHIGQLAVQCFFPESSKSRFLNSQRTVEFFLKEVLQEIKSIKKDAE